MILLLNLPSKMSKRMTGKDNDSYKFERCGNKIMKNNQEPCTMYSK
jgi:hypothetical protein